MSGSTTSSDAEVQATPIVIVAGPDLDTDFTSKSHLLVDGKEASIAFLREYFRNGKDAVRADKTVRNKQGYLSLSGVYLKQFLHKNRGDAGAATVIHYFNDATAAVYDRAVASASVLLISTTLMPTWSFVESLAERAKRINPTITVIAGGVSVYKIAKARKMLDAGLFEATPKLREFWKFLMKPYQSKIDFAIASVAGEQILLTLLDCLEQGSDAWKTMPNVIWYDPSVGDFHMNELVEEKSSDCEVDWSQEKCPEGSIYPVQAGQGCPYKCGFCDFVALEPVVYRCNTTAVMNTVRSIPLYKGHRRVWFTNDNLLVTRSVAVNFLTELIRQDLHCRWYSFLRLDAVADAELADLIAQSGCERANFGLESGDQTILDNMEKHCRVQDIPRGINFLLERNIIVRVSVIVGYPGETKETIMKTVKLVNSIQDTGVFEVKVFPLGIFPMAPISTRQQRQRWGLQGIGLVWKHDTMTSTEAAFYADKFDDWIRPTIGSVYCAENCFFFDVEDPAARRTVIILRNMLRRRSRGNREDGDPRTDEQLWEALEAVLTSN